MHLPLKEKINELFTKVNKKKKKDKMMKKKLLKI